MGTVIAPFLCKQFNDCIMKIHITREIIVVLIVYLFFIASVSSVYVSGIGNQSLIYFEAHNIAKSIVSGDGFSNPFRTCDTGYTAWMTPLLVYLEAIIFKLFDDNTSYYVLLNLNILLSVTGLYFIVKSLNEYSKSLTNAKSDWIISSVFVCYVFLHRSEFAFFFNDFGIISFKIGVGIHLLFKLFKNNYLGYWHRIYLFFLPLAVPSILLPIVTLIIINYILRITRKKLFFSDFNHIFRFTLPYVKLAVIVSLSLLLWGLRNYYTFDKMVLTKSNFWFEFYLANVVSNDGLNSKSVLEKHHPNENVRICKELQSMENEIIWVENYKTISKEYLKENTSDYFKKLWNRLVNAFIFTKIQDDVVISDFLKSLDSHDRIFCNYSG